MKTAALAALSLATAVTASAGLFGDDCSRTEARNAVIGAAGVTRIVVVGRAGTLKVEGKPTNEVRATGTACASSDSLLRDTRLIAKREGTELRIEAEVPDELFMETAKLDFVVTLPSNVPVRVEDGSGALEIVGTAKLDVRDGSGSMTVKNVNGDLTINDGSGGIEVADVTGEVRITDGSGPIDINRAGSVTIVADGSGSLDIADVKRNVLIEAKGSGSVHVARVGGDFTVAHKGSGAVEYEKVTGKVSVPAR